LFPKEIRVSTEDVLDLVRESFCPEQLRVARELRCWTQTQLAREAVAAGHERGLSAAAISQFELGVSVPHRDTVGALLRALRVDPEFLTTSASDDDAHVPAFFRSLRATPARSRRRARNLAQLVHRLAIVLDQHVGLPERDVPSIACDPFVEPDERRRVAERAAAAVRREWGLPRGPVRTVLGTLEAHGVACTRLLFDDERVDAFSVNFKDHPVAVLAADKDKWDRSRFDAAHELGHLVMHDEAAGVPEAERQANEFAAAFLMPERDIKGELPSRADWSAFMALKAEWGTSIASLVRRSLTLGVMSETTYVSANKVLSARGWRRHEPVEGEQEAPALLRRTMQRATKRGIAFEVLRREAVIPEDLFADVCQLISAD
jgi:Zn-dependent peptidase ImmA (M78 family)/transcriptional regulator with XRE-family HTH domain